MLLVKLQLRVPPVVFFFNDTATTEIYTLSLHDALPICQRVDDAVRAHLVWVVDRDCHRSEEHTSELQSHSFISYAVFCLKKTLQMVFFVCFPGGCALCGCCVWFYTH